MNEANPSVEERILRAVKFTLANVIRDTATPPGMRHPLSDSTIEDLRQCLALIAARERELATAAGRPSTRRPRHPGNSRPQPQVVRLHRPKPPKKPG